VVAVPVEVVELQIDQAIGRSHGGGREHRHEAPANPSAVSQEVDDVMNSLDL
jgi:hypothetical protein